MKNTILAAIAALSMIATPVVAEDFTDSTYQLDITSGALDFELYGEEDRLTDFEAGLTGFAHSYGMINGEARTALAYNFDDDVLAVRGEYNADALLSTDWAAYTSLAIEYASLNNNLSNGDLFFDPEIGLEYAIGSRVSLFSELGYTWAVTDDNLGASHDENGYAEAGLVFAMTDTVEIIPSIIREIDTVNEDTRLNFEVGLNF